MSVKVFRIEKAVPLPDLPDADAMCSDIRNSESNDVLFQLSKELTGQYKRLTYYMTYLATWHTVQFSLYIIIN